MFRMFPVNTSTNLNNVNVRTRSLSGPVSTNSLQFTSKVSTIFQIYNTKTYSCGSCGRG